jgi:hypothetical protein
MIQSRKRASFPAARLGAAAVAAGFGLAALLASALPADARGGRGFAGHGMHRASIAGNRHGNDAYIKAASEEQDKLLNTKIKSICGGC